MLHHTFEAHEHIGVAKSLTRHPWGVVTSTPDNPLWQVGNCIFVDPTVPMTLEQVQEAVDSAIQSKQQSAIPTIVFQMCRSETHPPKPNASHSLWKSALLERGFALEETPAKLMKWSASSISNFASTLGSNSLPHKVLESIDDITVSDEGASAYSKQDWLIRFRVSQLNLGPDYGCFMASLDPDTSRPVALVSIHRIEGIEPQRAAAINWCGTNPKFQRRGHAKNAMRHALEYIVHNCHIDEVYLTAIEDGPIKLYSELGFETVEEVVEWQFTKEEAKQEKE